MPSGRGRDRLICATRPSGRVDALDVGILRTLGFLPFIQGARPLDATRPSHVARALGASPELVKDRIDRMEAAGIILGYEIHPNLRHLGLRQVTFHLHVPPERKPQAMEVLSQVDGVAGVIDFVGTEMCVDVYHRSEGELARRLQLLSTITGVPQAHRLYENPDVAIARPLSRLDWRIVRALRGQARRSHAEVADELKVSQRTVKRRLERMAQEGSIDILPIVDPGRIPNYIPVGMAVFLRPGEHPSAVGDVRRALKDRLFYSWVPPARELGHAELALYARTTGEIEELRRTAAAVEGVARVDVALPCGARFSQTWLNEAIDERIRALPVVVSGNGDDDPES